MGGKGEGGQDIEGEKKEKKHVRRWWSSVNQKWVRHSCISRRPFQVHLVTQYEVVSMATRLQTFFPYPLPCWQNYVKFYILIYFSVSILSRVQRNVNWLRASLQQLKLVYASRVD